MILLALNSSVSRRVLEAKLDRMGFIQIGDQYCHFTGVLLSIAEYRNEIMIQVDHSPYDVEELIDYFYFRNIVRQKTSINEKELIPSFYSRPHSTQATLKDCILFLLSEQWPLSTMQIHQLVLRRFHRQITYQATHKSLRQLSSEGMLIKKDGKYKLNRSWLCSLNTFLDRVIRVYGVKDDTIDTCPSNLIAVAGMSTSPVSDRESSNEFQKKY